MKPFTSNEINSMKSTQASSLFDTCTITNYTVGLNSFGEQIKSGSYVTSASGIPCGVFMTNGVEALKGDVVQTDSDAVIRFANGVNVNNKSLITITHRFGGAVTNVNYEATEYPRIGISGTQIRVKRVTI